MSNIERYCELRYCELVGALERAIMGLFPRSDDPSEAENDQREIARCLLRALRINLALNDIAEADIKDHLRQIHKAMGAPGDWDYGTPIGSALSALYKFRPDEPALQR